MSTPEPQERQRLMSLGYAYPAYDLDDTGVDVLLSHTGTLDTTNTGGNGSDHRVINRGGYETDLGVDNSAAAISPYLRPDLDTDDLPPGYVAGPVYDGPIY